MDFVANRKWFFLISLLVILPGVVFLIIAPGLRPGIDFTGGSSLTLEFAQPVDQTALRGELVSLGQDDAIVQDLGDNIFFIRTREISDDQRTTIVEGLKTEFTPNDEVQVRSFDLVSPVVAQETVINGLYAVLAAAVGILIYLWWAFRNVPHPFRYGLAAVVALVHDVIIVVGIFAILGELANMEINTMFLIALLTVIGYSVNDTIVIFDKLRENQLMYPNRSFIQNMNVSISETLTRSINTGVSVMFTLLALLLFGGQTLQGFVLVLLIGLISGTYSSIAIACPFLAMWENGDFGRLFGRLRLGRRSAEPAPAR